MACFCLVCFCFFFNMHIFLHMLKKARLKACPLHLERKVVPAICDGPCFQWDLIT